MAATSLLKAKTLTVITGASRGYGRCIVEKLATFLPNSSMFLLLARNTDQLAEVKSKLSELNAGVDCVYEKFDQSNLKDCSMENIKAILSKNNIKMDDFDQIMIVHNSGSTGDLTKYTWDMTDSNEVNTIMNLNVTGTIVLNAALLTEARNSGVKSKVVINISSLAAIQAFPSWSLYCAGKAARDMFFTTLAKEDPNMRVLNWAPGPLNTDMQAECRKCADPKLREMFNDMHKNGNLIECEDSVQKMITVLEKNEFESGQHIDYYDV